MFSTSCCRIESGAPSLEMTQQNRDQNTGLRSIRCTFSATAESLWS
jgi:hypothetical protein